MDIDYGYQSRYSCRNCGMTVQKIGTNVPRILNVDKCSRFRQILIRWVLIFLLIQIRRIFYLFYFKGLFFFSIPFGFQLKISTLVLNT